MAKMQCKENTCKKVIEPSKNTGRYSKWIMIRAHNNGWYCQKNGDVWCPDHRPEWAPKLKVADA